MQIRFSLLGNVRTFTSTDGAAWFDGGGTWMMPINKKIHIFSGERKMSGENGFTLIEILIAISIFAIGLLAVAAMQITAFHGNRVGDELTKATILAQMQVEALKGADFNSANFSAWKLP